MRTASGARGEPWRGGGSGVALALLILLAGGCTLAEAPVLDPKGPVALAGRDILFRTFAIMMIVVIPVFAMTFWVIWRYRISHPRAAYDRDWTSGTVDVLAWIVPAAIVVILAVHAWVHTHRLDPYRPLAAAAPPLDVQVVAQDWKWLFLYPEQGVAAVNELAFPSARPIRLRITSDTVMNAFYIPALGSQIYAMAGMQTQLNLSADAPGRFAGRNSQYSGDGFADQSFAALAMTEADFAAWVEQARRSPARLDAAAYAALARPSAAHPVTHYAGFEPNLFATIMARYAAADPHRAAHR